MILPQFDFIDCMNRIGMKIVLIPKKKYKKKRIVELRFAISSFETAKRIIANHDCKSKTFAIAERFIERTNKVRDREEALMLNRLSKHYSKKAFL